MASPFTKRQSPNLSEWPQFSAQRSALLRSLVRPPLSKVDVPIILPPDLFYSLFLSQSVIPASEYTLSSAPTPAELKVKVGQRS